MRSAQNQANSAVTTAANTGADLGADASGISSSLTPFLTEEMLHPQGIGQAGLSAETAAAEGGAGGAASGLTGIANQRAAVSRNSGGYQAALDDAARQRTKAAADASEGIQAQNQNLEQEQSQEGASELGSMYKTDTSGMLQSQGQEAPDINAETNAGNSGWLQQTMGVLNSLGGAAGGAGSLIKGLRS